MSVEGINTLEADLVHRILGLCKGFECTGHLATIEQKQ